MKPVIKSAVVWVRVIRESIGFATHSLVTNRLRTILSLLGITIGIFSIISVFTVINSLERAIRKNIEELGDNVIYIQKWPIAFGPGFQWWKYISRPDPQYRELEELLSRSQLTEAGVFMIQGQLNLSYQNNSVEGIPVLASSEDYEKVRTFEIDQGRFISPAEFKNARNVAVVGRQIADDLYQGANPIGKPLELAGTKVTVIGTFKKEGEGVTMGSHDQLVVVPVNYARTLMNIRSPNLNPTIIVKAKQGISSDELSDELTGIMRSLRKLKPAEEDDFSLNTMSMISNAFDQIFITINLAGFIIGGFSILVGGFGIANIMFVSVRERTKLIGIQKAIGAKRIFILYEFLFEAVALAVAGGAVGLILIFFGTLIGNSLMNFKLVLGINNILLGLGISTVIGLIAGFAPAFKASRLNPVEAIATV